MRVWPCLLLAGCDLVFTVPDRPTGDDGAMPSCMAPIGLDENLTQGGFYVVDRADHRVVKQLAGDVLQATGDVDTHVASAFQPIFQLPLSTLYSAPQLAPGGLELVVRIDDDNGSRFAIAQRAGETWGVPAPIAVFEEDGFTGVVVGPSVFASPPTTTTPRRMTLASTRGVEEVVEMVRGRWVRAHLFPPSTFGVDFVEHAMLTPDGKALVFAGQLQSTFRVLRAERSAPDAASFFNPTVVHDLPSTTSTPFYTEDCQHHLYYTAANTVHHVIVP